MARILVVGSLAYSLINFRGALLSEMMRRGHEVICCAAENSTDVAKALKSIGARYLPLDFKRNSINPLHDILLLLRLIVLLRRLRPDIVLTYTIKPVIYGSLACRLAGPMRTYSMITGLGYTFGEGLGLRQKVIGMIVRALYKAALANNAGVFFQNPDDLALFTSKGIFPDEHKACLINGSGVDTDHFRPVPLPGRPVVFLLIARLLKDKGIFEYVAAASIVKKRHPEAIFRLLGPFDFNPAAISKDQIHAWHESGVVEYLGATDDVRPHLAACSVYVLPSYREGTPRTILEAMAMGRAVITTDAPGCRETVRDGVNGFLVPVKDATALANAMERFIDHPELIARMGDSGRKIAEAKYDVRKVNASILRYMHLDNDD